MINNRFFKEVFEQEIYGPVRNLGQMGDVIDLGACTGEFSLWVQGQAKRVWAIEPDIDAWEPLLSSIEGHTKIKPRKVGIAGENGKRKLWGNVLGGKTITGGQPDGETIPCVTLATFMKDNNIKRVDCLKVDVENAEKEIFDAQDFAEVAKNIKYIIGEHLVNSTTRLAELGFKCEPYQYGIIAKHE
jgi:FkbM family methyltransferase